MSKSLLARIAALEQQTSAAECLTVILASFTDAPLIGYRYGDTLIARRDNETDDELTDRASAEAVPEQWGGIVIAEVRA